MPIQDCLRGSLDKAHILYAPVEELDNSDRLLRACRILVLDSTSNIFFQNCLLHLKPIYKTGIMLTSSSNLCHFLYFIGNF